MKDLAERVRELRWPVVMGARLRTEGVVRDDPTADIGVVYFWTQAGKILASHGAEGNALKENHPRLSVASNLYSARSGLNPMIVNVAANPYIRHIICLGTELKKDPKSNSGRSLRGYFQNGVDDERRIIGNEEFGIDGGIPVEFANMLSMDVALHDLSEKGSLSEQIARANQLLDDIPHEGPSRDITMLELSKPKSSIMPFEGGSIVVKGDTVGATWLQVVDQIMRYGGLSLMEEAPKGEEGRKVRELNSLVAIILEEDPDSPKLERYPFLNLNEEAIREYIATQILSSNPPPEMKYAYGGKMRAYKSLVTEESTRWKDGEKIMEVEGVRRVVIDQVQEAIDVLVRDLYSKNVVISTWNPALELTAKRDSSPCAVTVHPLYKDGRLNINVTFRSHDMYEGWPMNAFGFLGLQKFMAEGVSKVRGEKIPPGMLTLTSESAQIYEKNWVDAERVLEGHHKFYPCFDDPRGYYIFAQEGDIMRVEHHAPEGKIDEFSGKPRKLRDRIALHGPNDPAHMAYIGWELAKADHAIRRGERYVQDKDEMDK